ncbi:response regulator [Herminiimonas fonticola]|uniref:Response regulator receiver modulated diguanylate cyclase n=1 Tax=Herminiimonas fonticola TaxID=303380 RepID=A0A4R6G6E3_9BURK|nr:response regulator [Herminiimonas fonticola]RBA24033.1 Response regulator receiver domain [Herminiimonas fonticola]TDN90032.1 response regulator receiver modulated diguanylate cyclase [Herminiimonas fonticola]
MPTDSHRDISLKPRILIADDSRIVRATLIKRIEGMFEFREALDGEQAWEMLLIDPSIRVVISDLTMPKLDGYGLLKRIRSSKIGRIRNMPVVVVSGSDEQAERDRAKAAGATDLITKGMSTGQLLSRLDILSKLISTQNEFERGLEALVQHVDTDEHVALLSPEVWQEQAEGMRASAVRQNRNFVVLTACIGLKHVELDAYPALPPPTVINAIGQLLHRTVRQTDCVARTGEIEFTIATGSIHFDSARNFAERVCRAIAHANLIKDGQMALIASCGVVSISEYADDAAEIEGSLAQMRVKAKDRALLGLQNAITGVIGTQEELLLKQGGHLSEADINTIDPAQSGEVDLSIDLATLLRWIKEGKEDQVLAHIGKLSTELQPLVDLLLKQYKV